MNTKKIGCHEPNYGSLNCSSSDFLCPSSQKFNSSSFLSDCSPWKNNLDSSNFFSCSGEGSAMPPCNSPIAFTKSVGSTTSTFSSTENLMEFPQFEHQVSFPPVSYQPPMNSLDFSVHVSPVSQFSFKPEKKRDTSHSLEAFESEVKFPLHEYGNSAVCDKRQKLLHRHQQNVLAQLVSQSTEEGLDTNLSKIQSVSVETADRPSVGFNLENSLVRSSKFQLQNVKKHAKASIVIPISSYNPNSGSSLPSKTRIRWTPDLHEKFVECVNCLGGAEKATPKGILKLMDLDGLTIYHIKSHLQKFRLVKYMPESSEAKRKSSANELQQLDPKTGIRITEALQIQLQVQRHLHEQLEIQRNLQMRIEAQGRQLQKLFREQMKSNKNFIEAQDLDELFPAKPQDDQMFGVGEDHQNNHFPSKIS